MTVWQEFLSFLEGNKLAMVIILGSLSGIVLSAFIGGRCKSTGLYAALSLAFVCAQMLTFLVFKWNGAVLYLALATEGILFGFLYGILFAYLLIKEKIKARKARREEYKRRLQFVLPDRENAYLRDRLHTALKTIEVSGERKEFSTDKKSVGVRLRYARRMVAKVKGAALSPIERLDVEEMSRTLLLMEQKGKWSNGEIKMINEIFSCLLKLSAKYEVAV